MFLRAKIRHKDGKAHRAWSVVENRRVHDGRVVQRQVLYLGEINDSQRAAWSNAIEVFDETVGQAKQIALFPERSCCAGSGLRCGVDPVERHAVASASSMGCLLDGPACVGSVAVGRVLVGGASALARGNELAEHPEDLGQLPADFAGQRMEIASSL